MTTTRTDKLIIAWQALDRLADRPLFASSMLQVRRLVHAVRPHVLPFLETQQQVAARHRDPDGPIMGPVHEVTGRYWPAYLAEIGPVLEQEVELPDELGESAIPLMQLRERDKDGKPQEIVISAKEVDLLLEVGWVTL